MKEYKRTHLKEFMEAWSICGTECGACYYHGPLMPHNWRETPPHDWDPPSAKCASFEYFKFRTYSGVGRGDLASMIHDDPAYPLSGDLIKAIYTCTGCGMCSEICYNRRPLGAILAIREELVERGARLPEPLPAIDANVDKYNNIFGAPKAPEILAGIPTEGEDLYFVGCVGRYQKPAIARAVVEVLRAAGVKVACLGEQEKCCGLIPGHDGNTAILERKAAQNIEAVVRAGARRVIVSCAHCYKTLKFDYRLMAGELPFEVVHVAELFSQFIDQKRITLKRRIGKRITYHDPCFLGRYFHVLAQPRHILSSIPGIEFVEMEPYGKWSHCCGSGTKITSSCYPDFTRAVTRRRLEEGKKVADTIVTACNTCYVHMENAVKDYGWGLEIVDLPVLVAQAMGIQADRPNSPKGERS